MSETNDMPPDPLPNTHIARVYIQSVPNLDDPDSFDPTWQDLGENIVEFAVEFEQG